MKFRQRLVSIVTAITLTAFASSGSAQSGKLPLNLIPMYGYPDIEKTEEQKKLDEDFVRSVVGTGGSREEASKIFSAEAWKLLRNGDASNAMRRFNQSWLLNPNNYQTHCGFGSLLFAQRKPSEAIAHYEKALSQTNAESERPRLLSDAARAYSMLNFTATDKRESAELFAKTNSLFNEAITLDTKYGNAYRYWAMSLYLEGNYRMAWDVVKKARAAGGEPVPSDFIDAFSKKLPEPQ